MSHAWFSSGLHLPCGSAPNPCHPVFIFVGWAAVKREASHVGRRVVASHGGGRALQGFLFFLYIHLFNFPPVFPPSRLSSAHFPSEERLGIGTGSLFCHSRLARRAHRERPLHCPRDVSPPHAQWWAEAVPRPGPVDPPSLQPCVARRPSAAAQSAKKTMLGKAKHNCSALCVKYIVQLEARASGALPTRSMRSLAVHLGAALEKHIKQHPGQRDQ